MRNIGFQTGTVDFNPNSDVQGTDDDAVFAKQRQAYSNQSAWSATASRWGTGSSG